MAETVDETMVQETLEEQEAGALAENGKPAKKAKSVAAKGGAFIDANEKKATKPVRMKALEKEEKAKQKQEAATRNKRLKAERKRIETELDEANQKTAEEKKSMAKKKTIKGKVRGGKPKGLHADYHLGKRLGDDDAFVATMARYIKKDSDASWSTVIKAMRADGHAAGQKRARRLFPKAQKAANGAKAKSR